MLLLVGIFLGDLPRHRAVRARLVRLGLPADRLHGVPVPADRALIEGGRGAPAQLDAPAACRSARGWSSTPSSSCCPCSSPTPSSPTSWAWRRSVTGCTGSPVEHPTAFLVMAGTTGADVPRLRLVPRADLPRGLPVRPPPVRAARPPLADRRLRRPPRRAARASSAAQAPAAPARLGRLHRLPALRRRPARPASTSATGCRWSASTAPSASTPATRSWTGSAGRAGSSATARATSSAARPTAHPAAARRALSAAPRPRVGRARLWRSRTSEPADVTVLRGLGSPFRPAAVGRGLEPDPHQDREPPRRPPSTTGSSSPTATVSHLIAPENPLAVGPGKTATATVFVTARRSAFVAGERDIRFRIADGAGFSTSRRIGCWARSEKTSTMKPSTPSANIMTATTAANPVPGLADDGELPIVRRPFPSPGAGTGTSGRHDSRLGLARAHRRAPGGRGGRQYLADAGGHRRRLVCRRAGLLPEGAALGRDDGTGGAQRQARMVGHAEVRPRAAIGRGVGQGARGRP